MPTRAGEWPVRPPTRRAPRKISYSPPPVTGITPLPSTTSLHQPPPGPHQPICSGNRANSIYNRIFARSRTPKCAKLVLGASAVHVRSRLCSRFFGVGIQKNEKRAILCVKGAYCELVSSSSSLDKASQREPAIRRVFFARQAIISLPGGMRVHTRGLERPQLARHGLLSPVPTASLTRRRSLALHRRSPCRRHHLRPCRARACASCRPPWPTG